MANEELNPEELNIEHIAQVCHAANRELQVIQVTLGTPGYTPDTLSRPWMLVEEWEKESALLGVKAALEGATPKELHSKWAANKIWEGWVYGEVKDSVAKTHPCLVEYDKLPQSELIKDYVFAGIVNAFKKASDD